MNKGELIERVASELKTTRADAAKAVDAVIDSITTGLRSGDRVAIAGFGTFVKRRRSPRRGVNPATRAPMTIAATTTAGFKPAAALRQAL